MLPIEIARQATQAGGDVVMRYFREGFQVHSKEASNLVTDADLQSERAIVEKIHAAFPDHAVLGEEAYSAGDTAADHLWIIDPLDGTNNFAHGLPQFAISVAYYRAGRPECGVVFNPARGDWYEATRGGGAFHNGQPIRVAESTSLDQVLIGVGFYYDRGVKMRATLAAIEALFGQRIHGIRRFGAAALDLAMVAAGQFGAFFEYILSPWDFAAGRLLVEEAGGQVTTCTGAPLPLAKSTILASNDHLHPLVLPIVQAHLPPE